MIRSRRFRTRWNLIDDQVSFDMYYRNTWVGVLDDRFTREAYGINGIGLYIILDDVQILNYHDTNITPIFFRSLCGIISDLLAVREAL